MDAVRPRSIENEKLSASLTMLTPRSLPQLVPKERRQLAYFQAQAAPQLGGYLEGQIWSQLVLQLAVSEAPIRHTVQALTLLHESLVLMGNTAATVCDSTAALEIVHHYSTAIGCLRSHLHNEGWAKIEITLVACILCIGFEWLRGRADAAAVHLQAGLKILDQWQSKVKTDPDKRTVRGFRAKLIEDTIAPHFGRLALQAGTLYNFDVAWPQLPHYRKRVGNFTDLPFARDSLVELLGQMHMVQETRDILRGKGSASDLAYQKYRALLDQWKRNLDAVVAEQRSTTTTEPWPSKDMLELFYLMACVMLDNVHTTGVVIITCRENHKVAFRRMVRLAGNILNYNPVYFTADVGVVPMLYFIIITSTEPEVQQQADQLLEKHCAYEGHWNSSNALEDARRKVRMREWGNNPNHLASGWLSARGNRYWLSNEI